MKRIFVILLLLSVFFIPKMAKAEDFKIAVVDMKKVFSEYEKTKAMELKLSRQIDVFKEYLSQLNKQYTNLSKQFTQERDNAQNITMNIADREGSRKKAQELYETLQIKEQELKAYAEERKKILEKMQEDSRSEVLDEIKRCVRNHAITEGYAMVLDASGSSLNDVSMVIYHRENIDITATVITDLNRGYRENTKDPVTDKKAEKNK